MFNVLFYRNPLYAMSNKNDNYIFPKKLFSFSIDEMILIQFKYQNHQKLLIP